MRVNLVDALKTYDALLNHNEIIKEKPIEDLSYQELLKGGISEESLALTLPFCDILREKYDKRALIELYIPQSKILERRVNTNTPLIEIARPDFDATIKNISNKNYFLSEEYNNFIKAINPIVRMPKAGGLFLTEGLKDYFDYFELEWKGIGVIFLPFFLGSHFPTKRKLKKYLLESLEPNSIIGDNLNYVEVNLAEVG